MYTIHDLYSDILATEKNYTEASLLIENALDQFPELRSSVVFNSFSQRIEAVQELLSDLIDAMEEQDPVCMETYRIGQIIHDTKYEISSAVRKIRRGKASDDARSTISKRKSRRT